MRTKLYEFESLSAYMGSELKSCTFSRKLYIFYPLKLTNGRIEIIRFELRVKTIDFCYLYSLQICNILET